ncbi:hypothetical protein LBMAG52_18780 [Planctomycetia bacterium]|nr:hypothetical protein LBMAG52_18780 [Planctomycetia bacterium]
MAVGPLNASSMAGGVIAVGVVKYKHDNVEVRVGYTKWPEWDSAGAGLAESWRAWA